LDGSSTGGQPIKSVSSADVSRQRIQVGLGGMFFALYARFGFRFAGFRLGRFRLGGLGGLGSVIYKIPFG